MGGGGCQSHTSDGTLFLNKELGKITAYCELVPSPPFGSAFSEMILKTQLLPFHPLEPPSITVGGDLFILSKLYAPNLST